MQFRAVIIPSGNATAVEIPDAVMASPGPEARPPVSITVNGYTWRSRVAIKNGQRLVGVSAAHREAAGIAEGQAIDLDITLDTAPREVEEPDDLKSALDANPTARAAFDKLPFGLRAKHVRDIEAAKTPEVRARRIFEAGRNARRLTPTASARTAARYPPSSARHKSAARGCTGPNAASLPSRAAARSFPRRAAAAPSAPSRGRPSAR